MSKFYPEPYDPFGGHINVTVDLSNYATKTDLKNVTHNDTSSFAFKKKIANLKTLNQTLTNQYLLLLS